MPDKIYVIGDSHVNFFSGQERIYFTPFKNGINNCLDILQNFKTFHLGPALAYNLNKLNTTTGAREKIDYLLTSKIIPEKAFILCCFGEIDIRVHVFQQSERKHLTYKAVVDDILNEYRIFLQEMLSRGYKMICWGPIASQKDNWGGNNDFPCYGSEQERNRATEYFNRNLQKICADCGAEFVSIFADLIDDRYYTKKEYIADYCHLSQKAVKLAQNKFVFWGRDIFKRRKGCLLNFYYHKYQRLCVRILCWFIPLKKWRKKLRNYYRSL